MGNKQAKPQDTPAITLKYFDIGGKADPIRLAFAIGGVTFEQEFVQFQDWPTVKPTTPFGQLPVMTVAEKTGGTEVVVAESGAQLRLAGKLSGLYPENGVQAAECDQWLDVMETVWFLHATSSYPAKFGITQTYNPEEDEEKKAAHKKAHREWLAENSLRQHFQWFSEQLAKNGTGWLVGQAVTIADLKLMSLVRMYTSGIVDHIEPTVVDQFEGLRAHMDRVLAIPQVVDWYAAEEERKNPTPAPAADEEAPAAEGGEAAAEEEAKEETPTSAEEGSQDESSRLLATEESAATPEVVTPEVLVTAEESENTAEPENTADES